MMRLYVNKDGRRSTRGRKRFIHILTITVLVLALPGCGGGGSDAGQSALSITPSTISVSATDIDPAPTAKISVNIFGLKNNQVVYLSDISTHHGISDITNSGGGVLPAVYTIQFDSPASIGIGSYADTITISACYDTACERPVKGNPQTVRVNYTVTKSVIAITDVSPESVIANGPAFTLVVTGTDFTPQSTVLWNGTSEPTTFDSATQLSAQIPAAAIAEPTVASLSVTDPLYGISKVVKFTVNPITTNPLSLTSVSPPNVTVGGAAFTLTVLGHSFSTASIVEWNGAALPTTYVSLTELLAQVPIADISASGSASVKVIDPTNSPDTTAAQTVSIVPMSIDAVGFQMNAAHTGAVTFKSVSFPSSSSWSVDVGGTPSYAVIADGLVIVTVSVTGGNSELRALDQATGNTVWGPITISGPSNATYDDGRVFALSAPGSPTVTMEAFDATTGTPDWSTVLVSGTYTYNFTAAPTAADGAVYVGGSNDGGAIYALDETTGALLWTQNVNGGDDSIPAVTADGLYVSYPCWTYDLRPATGESIWNNDTGCFGGGGATPVVANQLLYSPGYAGDAGYVFNAETGAIAGSYDPDSPAAFTTSMSYFLQSGTLQGVRLSDNSVQWSFTGDRNLAGSPIAVNQYVFIGSRNGNLYALDGATGALVWSTALSAPIEGGNIWLPYSGLAAGDGLLVVPSGTTITAYTLSTDP